MNMDRGMELSKLWLDILNILRNILEGGHILYAQAHTFTFSLFYFSVSMTHDLKYHHIHAPGVHTYPNALYRTFIVFFQVNAA